MNGVGALSPAAHNTHNSKHAGTKGVVTVRFRAS